MAHGVRGSNFSLDIVERLRTRLVLAYSPSAPPSCNFLRACRLKGMDLGTGQQPARDCFANGLPASWDTFDQKHFQLLAHCFRLPSTICNNKIIGAFAASTIDVLSSFDGITKQHLQHIANLPLVIFSCSPPSRYRSTKELNSLHARLTTLLNMVEAIAPSQSGTYAGCCLRIVVSLAKESRISATSPTTSTAESILRRISRDSYDLSAFKNHRAERYRELIAFYILLFEYTDEEKAHLLAILVWYECPYLLWLFKSKAL